MKEGLLVGGEQIVAPGDGVAERLLALGEVPGAAGQQGQAVDEPRQHLLGGQPPYSLIIGNAAATKIMVGGQPFDFRSVVRGNVARFILDPAPKPKP